MVEQAAGDACILTGYRSHATQCLYCTQGNIAQIANRRGDNVKSGLKLRVHAQFLWTGFRESGKQ